MVREDNFCQVVQYLSQYDAETRKTNSVTFTAHLFRSAFLFPPQLCHVEFSFLCLFVIFFLS